MACWSTKNAKAGEPEGSSALARGAYDLPSPLVKRTPPAKTSHVATSESAGAAGFPTGTLARAMAKKVRTPPPPKKVQAPQRRDTRRGGGGSRPALGLRGRRRSCGGARRRGRARLRPDPRRRGRRNTDADDRDELQRTARSPEDEGALAARVRIPRRPAPPARPDDAGRPRGPRRCTSTPTSTSSWTAREVPIPALVGINPGRRLPDGAAYARRPRGHPHRGAEGTRLHARAVHGGVGRLPGLELRRLRTATGSSGTWTGSSRRAIPGTSSSSRTRRSRWSSASRRRRSLPRTSSRRANRRRRSLSVPGAGLEPARPRGGHPILSRARITSFATPARPE